MRQPFRMLGSDLYFDLQCTCPDKKWADSDVAHLFKTKIQLTGYYDHYFFHEVNKEPREGQCQCGRKFKYQWFPDGVEAEFVG